MIKLHLGCGKRNFGEEWIHIDGGDYAHLEDHNICDLSQYPDNHADLIYASHVLEYFDREEVVPVLREWYQVLKPGGILRVAVPDFKELVCVYIKHQYDIKSLLGPLYGKMKMGDTIIYHKTAYDEKSLSELLKQIGFSKIRKYDWRKTEHSMFDDHSQAYLPKMDKENGKLISLNMEAVK